LLDHLDDRPVRDALAVREATPLNDLGLNGGKRLRDQPRLTYPASPTTVTSWQR
jgi:hypothetical protein